MTSEKLDFLSRLQPWRWAEFLMPRTMIRGVTFTVTIPRCVAPRKKISDTTVKLQCGYLMCQCHLGIGLRLAISQTGLRVSVTEFVTNISPDNHCHVLIIWWCFLSNLHAEKHEVFLSSQMSETFVIFHSSSTSS